MKNYFRNYDNQFNLRKDKQIIKNDQSGILITQKHNNT